MASVTIKLSHGNDIRRRTMSAAASSVELLRSWAQNVFGLTNVKLTLRDSDGDTITVGTNEELREILGECGGKSVKFDIQKGESPITLQAKIAPHARGEQRDLLKEVANNSVALKPTATRSRNSLLLQEISSKAAQMKLNPVQTKERSRNEKTENARSLLLREISSNARAVKLNPVQTKVVHRVVVNTGNAQTKKNGSANQLHMRSVLMKEIARSPGKVSLRSVQTRVKNDVVVVPKPVLSSARTSSPLPQALKKDVCRGVQLNHACASSVRNSVFAPFAPLPSALKRDICRGVQLNHICAPRVRSGVVIIAAPPPSGFEKAISGSVPRNHVSAPRVRSGVVALAAPLPSALKKDICRGVQLNHISAPRVRNAVVVTSKPAQKPSSLIKNDVCRNVQPNHVCPSRTPSPLTDAIKKQLCSRVQLNRVVVPSRSLIVLTPAAVSETKTASGAFKDQAARLQEMGFKDLGRNQIFLQLHHGDLLKTINSLLQ